jgi:hypothetical protein
LNESPTTSGANARRTAAVWIISGLIVVSVLGTDLYLLLHLLGVGSDTAFASRLAAMTTADYARRTIFGVLELAAAVSLFLLRRVAVQLFLGLLVLFIAFILYSLLSGPLAFQDFLTVAAGGLIVFGVPLWYSLRLDKKGVLR